MSASGHGRDLGGIFTPLSYDSWVELMALADQAVTSPEAADRLRLAVADLAPGFWLRIRAGEQADRIAERRQADT